MRRGGEGRHTYTHNTHITTHTLFSTSLHDAMHSARCVVCGLEGRLGLFAGGIVEIRQNWSETTPHTHTHALARTLLIFSSPLNLLCVVAPEPTSHRASEQVKVSGEVKRVS